MRDSVKIKQAFSPAIVVAAWRRPGALKRLLQSLLLAHYPKDEEITLVISLDGGADEETIAQAMSFAFPAGRCEVVQHPENLGVRRHILWCGDQCQRFESVIVLEEDLLVDRDFYRFAQSGLHAYHDAVEVAGLALYAPEFNEIARLPFVPADNGYDAYFMQFPCSSGQVWSLYAWREFRAWLDRTGDFDVNQTNHFESLKSVSTGQLPAYIAGWPDSSWKKWYAAWLVETQRFFVYPYKSLATNCSDPGGMHVANEYQPDVQVAIPITAYLDTRIAVNVDQFWKFPQAGPSPYIAYDAYMEACGTLLHTLLEKHTSGSTSSIQADLYGTKPTQLLKRFEWCVSMRKSGSPYSYFPLHFRPIEVNLAFPCEESRGFFVLSRTENSGRVPLDSRFIITRYFMRGSLFRFDFLTGYLTHAFKKIMQQAIRKLKQPF